MLGIIDPLFVVHLEHVARPHGAIRRQRVAHQDGARRVVDPLELLFGLLELDVPFAPQRVVAWRIREDGRVAFLDGVACPLVQPD
eukprot:5989668-Prymnesium_polylepis.1